MARAAAELGMPPTGLKRFLQGGSVYGKTTERIEAYLGARA